MDKKTILVVEDEVDLLELIQKKLEASGFSTLTARTVSDALDILGQKKIDALWLDHYLLGERNGFDLVVELKSHEKLWGKIPIFLVSNTAGPEQVESYIELGIKKYYVKANTTLSQIVKDIQTFFTSPEA